MDIRNAIVDLWELAGEPSDLDPWAEGAVDYDVETDLDEDSQGVKYYLRRLSRAQVALVNWRTRKGRAIRFKKFFTSMNVKLGRNGEDYPYTVSFVDKWNLRISGTTTGLSEENLTNAKIIVNWKKSGETTIKQEEYIVGRAVYNAAGPWFTLAMRDEITDYDATYDDSTVEVYWDRFVVTRTNNPSYLGNAIEVPSKFRNILKVTNMDDGSDLKRAESKENLFNPFLTFGTPSEWYNIGDILYLDQYLEEGIWHTVEYQRLPNDLTSLDDEFEIPEEWHDVVLLIVEWLDMKRLQDKQRANELYVEISRWIDTLRTDFEEDWIRDHTSGFYIRKEAR